MPSTADNRNRVSTWTRRITRRACASLLSAVLIGGGYLGVQRLTGNVHSVVARECYRSAQLSPAQIADCAAKYGIKTIINLRGPHTGTDWYDAEVSQAKKLGIAHVDFRMSASRELAPAEANQLIDLMKDAQKPVLVHCQGGADRAGLASALYLAAIHKTDEDAAEAQLSIRFGHFSLPFMSVYAMDRTFEKLEPSLGLP